ncbi:hypothetical protein ACVGXC_03710, partial [Enterobacter hormaechei]
STNSAGMNTIPTTVATSMPLNTVVPLYGGQGAPPPGASNIRPSPKKNHTPGINNPPQPRPAAYPSLL